MSDIEKIQERKLESHKHYDVWEETWNWGDGQDPQSSKMIMARNKEGDWIGDKEMAEALAKHDIAPEMASDEHDICCIGWSEEHQRYFGWSHRALVGFGIGDMIFEEDFGDGKTPFIKHGRVEIESKEDARRAAIKFAEYVG